MAIEKQSELLSISYALYSLALIGEKDPDRMNRDIPGVFKWAADTMTSILRDKSEDILGSEAWRTLRDRAERGSATL